MEIFRIAALFAAALILCAALEAGWHAPEGKALPQLYLQVERMSPEEQHGVLSIAGDESPLRNIGVLVRRRGNSSAKSEKWSYHLRFGQPASLLGMDAGEGWILLGMPFDKSLIRTTLAFEYARSLGLDDVSQTRFCELHVQGDYRGVYLLTEPVTPEGLGLDTSDFILERNKDREEAGMLAVVTDAGIRFELDCGRRLTDGAAELALLNRAERAMVSGDMAQYERYIDVDSFVNTYILQEVIKCVDFAAYSDRYYVRGGRLYAGPLWDVDLSMGNVTSTWMTEPNYRLYYNAEGDGDGSGDSVSGLWAQRDWFAFLCRDEAFMQRVRARWREIYPVTENLVSDNHLGQNRIDATAGICMAAAKDNYDPDSGWSLKRGYPYLEYNGRFRRYDQTLEHLRDWLARRIDWLNSRFAG